MVGLIFKFPNSSTEKSSQLLQVSFFNIENRTEILRVEKGRRKGGGWV